jgi:hypothetical protein
MVKSACALQTKAARYIINMLIGAIEFKGTQSADHFICDAQAVYGRARSLTRPRLSGIA